jgi:hypothetical protein
VALRDLSVTGKAVVRLADTVSHGKDKEKYILLSFFSSSGCSQLIVCFREEEKETQREEEEEEEEDGKLKRENFL